MKWRVHDTMEVQVKIEMSRDKMGVCVGKLAK
jgi:hypothetical protein